MAAGQAAAIAAAVFAGAWLDEAVEQGPAWITAPALSGENWPGGLMESDGGDPGDNEPVYDWTIDDVSTGESDAFEFTVPLDGYIGDLIHVGDIDGELAPSDPVPLTEISGATRGATIDGWVSRANTAPAAAGCTLLVEFIGFADGLVIGWGRGTTGTNRREMAISLSAGSVVGLLWTGTGTTCSFAHPASGLTDGTTRHIVAFDFTTTGSLARLAYIPPGGTPVYVTTPTSGSWLNPFTATSGGRTSLFRRCAELVTSGRPAAEWIGVAEGAFLSARLATTDYDAIAAAGSLTAWGLWDRGDIQDAFHPAPGVVEQGYVVGNAGDIEQASWTVHAPSGGDELAVGGLNVPV